MIFVSTVAVEKVKKSKEWHQCCLQILAFGCNFEFQNFRYRNLKIFIFHLIKDTKAPL